MVRCFTLINVKDHNRFNVSESSAFEQYFVLELVAFLFTVIRGFFLIFVGKTLKFFKVF